MDSNKKEKLISQLSHAINQLDEETKQQLLWYYLKKSLSGDWKQITFILIDLAVFIERQGQKVQEHVIDQK